MHIELTKQYHELSFLPEVFILLFATDHYGSLTITSLV